MEFCFVLSILPILLILLCLLFILFYFIYFKTSYLLYQILLILDTKFSFFIQIKEDIFYIMSLHCTRFRKKLDILHNTILTNI